MQDEKGPGLKAVANNVTQLKDMPRKYADAYTVHTSALLEDETVEIDFLVEGCIPRRNIILLTGESGAGKTWVAYELVRAVASGTKWMGRGLTAGAETVLVLNYDSPTDTMKRRIKRLSFVKEMTVYFHTLGMTKPPVSGMPEMLRLLEEEGKLKLVIQHLNPTLIVVDSLRQGHTLNEDDNKDMSKLMEVYKSWTKNAAVVLIHHTAKTDKSSWQAKARGSGEIIASSDVVIEVAENKLTWTKSRTWNIGDTTETPFSISDVYIDPSGKVVEEKPDKSLGAEWVPQNVTLKTTVSASSFLPGEQDRTVMNTIVDIVQKHNKIMTIEEIQAATKGIAMPLVKRAVKDASEKKLLSMYVSSRGNAYGPPIV